MVGGYNMDRLTQHNIKVINRKRNITNIIVLLFSVVGGLFLLYCMVSYFQVLSVNLHSGEIADWNIFNIFMNFKG